MTTVHSKGAKEVQSKNFYVNFLRFQRSTKYSPHFAQFGRHPRTPGTTNTSQTQCDDTSVVVTSVAEEELEAKAADIAALHSKVRGKLKCLQQKFILKNLVQ